MSQLFNAPFNPPVGVTGLILDGCKWYFYLTGTTTAAPVYSDKTLGTSLGSVITADASGRFVNIFLDPTVQYRAKLKTSAGVDVPGCDFDPVNDTLQAQLAASGGSALVGFLQAGTGAVARTVQSKLRDSVSVKDFGATGDGTTDDTAAIHAARDSGAARLIFPEGSYRTTGLVFNASDDVVDLEFDPGSEILLVSAASRIALDIQKHGFSIHGILSVRATGTAYDGLATVGVRHGTVAVGYSYMTIERLTVSANFSSRGFVSYGCVNVRIGRADINGGTSIGGNPSTCYSMSFEPGASGCTMVGVEQAYISGGRRSFNGDSMAWFDLGSLTVEYGGRGGGNVDGALHLKACANGLLRNLYGEQNERNIVLDDSTPTFINKAMFTALTSADVVSYTAVAFASRGVSDLTNRSLTVGEILPDANVNVAVTTGLHLSGSGAAQIVNLNGTQILAVRQAAVADAAALTYVAPTGGGTVDTQARASLVQLAADVTSIRTQLNLLLAKQRLHGLIAP